MISAEQELARARQYLADGDYFQATIGYERVIQSVPNFPGAKEVEAALTKMNSAIAAAAEKRMPGPIYLDWLRWFHDSMRPATYLEIGVETGQSMRFAKPPTRAVGIDPKLRIQWAQQTQVELFEMTSDQFFATQDLRKILEHDIVEFAFLDGLHTFDQTLRDFINVEKFSNRQTVVVLHDVLPATPITADRDRKTVFWVGDTWKILPILREHRPDLRIITIPTYPSGLAVVTRLDPTSSRLNDVFDEAVQRFLPVRLEENLAQFERFLNQVPNDASFVANWLKAESKA